jgi:uncharacterized protein (DUF362 family)
MSGMNRRTFLLHTGRWLAIASLAPLLPACAREVTTTGQTVGEGSAATGAGGSSASTVPTDGGSGSTAQTAGGATATTTGGSTSTNTSGSTTPGALDLPDVAVTSGDVVEKNLRAAIALLGGMERFVQKGGKVVLKPNVLTGRPPEYATTTSPELMTAVIMMCWEAGAKEVVVFDNPTSSHRAAFEVSGLAKAVSAADGKLVYLNSRDYQEFDVPDGKVLTKWEFVAEALETDTLINLALPKHHSVAGATMTMKNLMGIMGGRRGTIHADFAQKIVDVNTLVKPTLAILDGYRVLFRHGPTGGSLDDVRLAKTLVAGANPVSVDSYGTQFFDKKPADFKWLVEANKRGMGEIDLGKLRIATAQA